MDLISLIFVICDLSVSNGQDKVSMRYCYKALGGGWLLLFRISDVPAPHRLKMPEMIIIILRPWTKPSKDEVEIVVKLPENIPTMRECGRKNAKITVAIEMLISCPVNLIVPRNPAAIPEYFRSAEPMTELVFGAENNPNPIPMNASIIISWISVMG